MTAMTAPAGPTGFLELAGVRKEFASHVAVEGFDLAGGARRVRLASWVPAAAARPPRCA